MYCPFCLLERHINCHIFFISSLVGLEPRSSRFSSLSRSTELHCHSLVSEPKMFWDFIKTNESNNHQRAPGLNLYFLVKFCYFQQTLLFQYVIICYFRHNFIFFVFAKYFLLYILNFFQNVTKYDIKIANGKFSNPSTIIIPPRATTQVAKRSTIETKQGEWNIHNFKKQKHII